MAGPIRRQISAKSRLSNAAPDTARRFSQASEATQELLEAYQGWSGSLAGLAWKSALGLIAANWAVHGQLGIIQNGFARWSVMLALGYLLLLMLASGCLAWLHNKRYHYADEDRQRWRREFDEEAGSRVWPYTPLITILGQCLQIASVALPVASGVFLLLSVGQSQVSQAPSPKLGPELSLAAGASLRIPHAGPWDPAVLAMLAGLALMAAGTWGLLFYMKHRTVPAAVIGGVGLVLFSAGGVARFNGTFNTKFALETDSLIKIVREEVKLIAAPGPERIGSVEGFVSGEEMVLSNQHGAVVPAAQAPDIEKAVQSWIQRRADNVDGVLLVIGATDRQPLKPALRTRFETNVGLAQARGEVVKSALISRCRKLPSCTLSEDRVIVLVAGPRKTQVIAGLPSSDGYPEDRRVEIWALWSRKNEGVIRR